MRSVATFSSFPCSEQFCQSPHFSHPSGHRSLEKGRRGTGDFNLVSTSSNLKGRRGEGRHCRNGPGEISSEPENPEHNDSERDQEGGRQRAGRETNRETGNYVPLDWARCEGAGRVTWPGPGPGTLHWSLKRERTRGLRAETWTQENWK